MLGGGSRRLLADDVVGWPSSRAPAPLGPSPAKTGGVALLPSPYTTPSNPRRGLGAQRSVAAICALIEAAPFRFERGATELNISWY
jgi:hypothetical protein